MQDRPQNRKPTAQDAMALANSKEGKQLLQSLQESHSDEMSRAFQLASSGDYTQLKSTVEKLMDTPEAKAILNQLKGYGNG